jgi:hypothetical protein
MLYDSEDSARCGTLAANDHEPNAVHWLVEDKTVLEQAV